MFQKVYKQIAPYSVILVTLLVDLAPLQNNTYVTFEYMDLQDLCIHMSILNVFT